MSIKNTILLFRQTGVALACAAIALSSSPGVATPVETDPAVAATLKKLPDLSSVPADLAVPPIAEGTPAAGKRVAQTTPGWEGTRAHHALYLPVDWKPGDKFPVIVEYAGNGGFHNAFGDVCEGTVEGSKLGYGLSAGRGSPI